MDAMNNLSAVQAVAHSYMNRDEIERSELCGCFSCLAQFLSSDIYLWSDSIDEEDEEPGAIRPSDAKFRGFTAVCPCCEEPSVIGSASGASISENFLREVNLYWKKK